MRTFIKHCNKRLIAVVMLLVWMFTLGAGLANACLLDRVKSEPASLEHHGGAASTMVTVSPEANALTTPGQYGDNRARSHQVHCEALQAVEHAPVSRQATDKSFDQDTIMASIAHRVYSMRPAHGRASVRLRPDPVAAHLPLFIRFQRLTL